MAKFTEDSMIKVLKFDKVLEGINSGDKQFKIYDSYKMDGIGFVTFPDGMLFLFDKECCGEIMNPNETDKEKMVEVGFSIVESPSGSGSRGIKMYPEAIITFPPEDFNERLEDEFTVVEISLKDYMGSRYNYNGRLAYNMSNVVRWMNGGKY